jgi:release factor glutamine methyltransferase
LPALRYFVPGGWGRLANGPHPDRARQDAETLLLHVLKKNKAWLLAHADDDLPEDQAVRFSELLERRFCGEPIQYIIGEAEFYGLPFRVTPEVLIPRPETEHLVEKALEVATLSDGYSSKTHRILDVGTGSGAIAIALAHHLPNAQLTALDISSTALDIARENARHNAVADRIQFIQSDLLASVAHERFDMVVSNPPYVALTDRQSLSVEVRDHEPTLALFAGEDGLDIYRRLIPEAFAVLEAGGYLLMEIGFGQSSAIATLLKEAGFEGIEFVPDLQGIPRVACAQRP